MLWKMSLTNVLIFLITKLVTLKQGLEAEAEAQILKRNKLSSPDFKKTICLPAPFDKRQKCTLALLDYSNKRFKAHKEKVWLPLDIRNYSHHCCWEQVQATLWAVDKHRKYFFAATFVLTLKNSLTSSVTTVHPSTYFFWVNYSFT